MNPLLVIFGSGLLAGAMNALAGGGTFVALPALISVGVPSVQANASSTVGLFPGTAASAWAYYGGALLGRRAAPQMIRAGTLLIASGITLLFFVRTYVKLNPVHPFGA
jgi:uncharacterized membrane protein YfcA